MTGNASDTRLPSILLIDDDPGTIQVLRKALSEYSDVRFATRGEEGLALASDLAPDLVLLDAEMPGLSGMDTLRRIKAQPQLADVAVMFVTSHDRPELEIEALDLGAADFVGKPVNANLLRARVRTQLRLKRLTDELKRMARRDGLTGLANRLELDEFLDREWRRALRSEAPLSLVLIDVDHFKRYNDALGHLAGDDALRAVARVLVKQAHRGGDLAARYGGEEFLLILPSTTGDMAQQLAMKIRRDLTELAIPHPDSPTASVLTMSMGIATLTPHLGMVLFQQPASSLIGLADEALYAAKQAGRNQAVFREYQRYSALAESTPGQA